MKLLLVQFIRPHTRSFVLAVAKAIYLLVTIHEGYHSNRNDRVHERVHYYTAMKLGSQAVLNSLSPKRSPSSSNTLSMSPSPPPTTGWVAGDVSAGTSLELTLPRELMEGREGCGAVVSGGPEDTR